MAKQQRSDPCRLALFALSLCQSIIQTARISDTSARTVPFVMAGAGPMRVKMVAESGRLTLPVMTATRDKPGHRLRAAIHALLQHQHRQAWMPGLRPS